VAAGEPVRAAGLALSVPCRSTAESAAHAFAAQSAPDAALRRSPCCTRRPDVREYPIDNEALIYDPQAKVLYHLNETACRVWRGCDGRTVDHLAAALSATYDVDKATAAGHVAQLIGLFEIGGLLAREAADAL